MNGGGKVNTKTVDKIELLALMNSTVMVTTTCNK